MLVRNMPRRSSANANPADPTVRLIEPSLRPPATSIEVMAVTALRQENPISLSSLIENVARTLYSEELANGGSVLEIGLLGVDLFVRDVTFELKAGNGVLWHIETAQ